MGFLDFLKFLLGVEGFVPALIAFIGTILSLVFGGSIPMPEVIQSFLALLTLILTALAGYNGGVRIERMRNTAARKDCYCK